MNQTKLPSHKNTHIGLNHLTTHSPQHCKYHDLKWTGDNDSAQLDHAYLHILSHSPYFPGHKTQNKERLLQEIFHMEDIYRGENEYIIDSIIYTSCPNRPKGYKSPFNYISFNKPNPKTTLNTKPLSSRTKIKPLPLTYHINPFKTSPQENKTPVKATGKIQYFYGKPFSIASEIPPYATPDSMPNSTSPQKQGLSSNLLMVDTPLSKPSKPIKPPISRPKKHKPPKNHQQSKKIRSKSTTSTKKIDIDIGSVENIHNPWSLPSSTNQKDSKEWPIKIALNPQFDTLSSSIIPNSKENISFGTATNSKNSNLDNTNNIVTQTSMTSNITQQNEQSLPDIYQHLLEKTKTKLINNEWKKNLKQCESFFNDLLSFRITRLPLMKKYIALDYQPILNSWRKWQDFKTEFVAEMTWQKEQSISEQMTNEEMIHEFTKITNELKKKYMFGILEILDELEVEVKKQEWSLKPIPKKEILSPEQIAAQIQVLKNNYIEQLKAMKPNTSIQQNNHGIRKENEDSAESNLISTRKKEVVLNQIIDHSLQQIHQDIQINRQDMECVSESEINDYLINLNKIWQTYIQRKALVSIQVALDKKLDLLYKVSNPIKTSTTSTTSTTKPTISPTEVESLKQDIIKPLLEKLKNNSPNLTPNLIQTARGLVEKPRILWNSYQKYIEEEWFYQHLKYDIERLISVKYISKWLPQTKSNQTK